MREEPYRLFYRLPGGFWVPAIGQVRRYTPHGPVLALDRDAGVAYSMRWSALVAEPTLRGLVGLEEARDVATLAARVRTLVTPTVNVVAADRDGRVRYQTAGAVPRRPFAGRLGPLPSDGRHEWASMTPADAMPAWDVPRGGFVVNANNRPVGGRAAGDWPRFDWAHDRARRITTRLAGDPAVTLADLRSIQNDVVSPRAARVLPRLLVCADSLGGSLRTREREALDVLRAWDLVCRRDRVAPTLYRAWYGAWQRRSGIEGLEGLAIAALDGRAPEAVRGPDARSPERAAATAVEALRTALDTLAVALGPDIGSWTWGRAHLARFRHALRGVRAGFDDLRVPVDGENGTPCVGASRLPWSVEVSHGPAFRHLVDLAEPRFSWAVVPPGNSGDRDHVHANGHLDRWANHGYVALHLDWSRVERARDAAWTLTPATR
jgi:penicillin amidase